MFYFIEKWLELNNKNNLLYILIPYNMSSMIKGYMKLHENWNNYKN